MRQLIGPAILMFVISTAWAAKRLTEQRGHPGWLYFLLVLFAFPIGVLVTGAIVLLKPERRGG